jgi:signal transduction histidine kinase
LSSAEILQREPKLTDIGQEMTEFIISETARLNALITTLLACAKPQQPAFIHQDISKTIKHCLELLQHQADQKQIHLALEYAETPIYIAFDHDLMLQVFLNLLMNAIQHVNQGGKVVVCLQASELAATIYINDDGVGISDDDKAKVFEPFFTQRRDGIGLGLTVVQQIIHAHRGKITVTDSSYGGASFQITLPLTQSDNSQ